MRQKENFITIAQVVLYVQLLAATLLYEVYAEIPGKQQTNPISADLLPNDVPSLEVYKPHIVVIFHA